MNKILSRKAAAGAMALGAAAIMAMPLLASAAIGTTSGFGITEEGTFGAEVGLGKRDVKATVGDIINIVLGVLGIIAVVIILAGGFKWMTAGGNEDKVGEARKMIIQGVIGLVIVFAAWGIASFVVNQLSQAAS